MSFTDVGIEPPTTYTVGPNPPGRATRLAREAEERLHGPRIGRRPRPIRYVYLAGPITKGDQFANVRAALDANKKLMDAGLYPFCPHLSCFAHVTHPTPFDEWLAFDFGWIERCDALVRIPGESVGADRELAYARSLGLLTFEVDDTATLDVFVELIALNNVTASKGLIP